MVHNTEKRDLATYYRERGFSYSEIAKIVNVSKGTLSTWFATESFSQTVTEDNKTKARKENAKRITLLNKMREKERQKKYQDIEKQAAVEYKNYKSNPLFVAGLMLYVAEGDTVSPRLIRLASVRADLHRIFLKFARDFLGTEKEKVRFWLLLHPDLVEKDCVSYWSRQLKLSPTQFYKNQVIASKTQRDRLQYGVGNTIIGSVHLKKKLQKWVELATKEFTK